MAICTKYGISCQNCQYGKVEEDKYRWHDLRGNPDDLPEIVYFGTWSSLSEAVEVVDDFKVYDTAMIIEHHVKNCCDKVCERNWYFGEGGKWEDFDAVRAWRYIKPFEYEEGEENGTDES